MPLVHNEVGFCICIFVLLKVIFYIKIDNSTPTEPKTGNKEQTDSNVSRLTKKHSWFTHYSYQQINKVATRNEFVMCTYC